MKCISDAASEMNAVSAQQMAIFTEQHANTERTTCDCYV